MVVAVDTAITPRPAPPCLAPDSHWYSHCDAICHELWAGRGQAGPRRLLYGYDCPRGQSRGKFDIGLGALSPQPFQPSNVQWGQEGVSQRRHGPFLGVPARARPGSTPGPTRSGQAVGAAVAARPVINDRFRLNIHTRPPTSSPARPGPARLSRRPRLGRPPGAPRSQAGTRR